MLLLTEKGTDYRAGGAYIRREAGKAIDTEAGSFASDMLVYDGNTLHGVKDIDPDLPFTPFWQGSRARHPLQLAHDRRKSHAMRLSLLKIRKGSKGPAIYPALFLPFYIDPHWPKPDRLSPSRRIPAVSAQCT